MVREGGIEALHHYYTRKQQTYWVTKLSRNVARNDRVTTELEALGWKVLRFWETDIARRTLRQPPGASRPLYAAGEVQPPASRRWREPRNG